MQTHRVAPVAGLIALRLNPKPDVLEAPGGEESGSSRARVRVEPRNLDRGVEIGAVKVEPGAFDIQFGGSIGGCVINDLRARTRLINRSNEDRLCVFGIG